MQKPKEFKIANHKPTKKTIILFTSLFSVIALIMIYSIVTTPRDLGPKLHYVGKADYGGCFMLYCESNPGHNYYYATDLSKEELVRYLKNAELINESVDGHGELPPTYHYMMFKSKVDGDDFYIKYYADTQDTLRQNKFKDLGYKYIIHIGDFDYDVLRGLL